MTDLTSINRQIEQTEGELKAANNRNSVIKAMNTLTKLRQARKRLIEIEKLNHKL